MKIRIISARTAFSLIFCHWISVNAVFKLKQSFYNSDSGYGPNWTQVLGKWPLFLKRSGISNLDRAIPNSCLLFLMLDCSETPI